MSRIRGEEGHLAGLHTSPRVRSVSVRAFGAVGDGIADDTDAFVAACGVGNTVVMIPPGTYVVRRTITVAPGTTVQGEGTASVIDGRGAATEYVFEASGSARVTARLGGLATRGDSSLRLAPIARLEMRRPHILYDDREGSWSQARPYYKAGEWYTPIVASLGVARTTSPLYGEYEPGPHVAVYEVLATSVAFRDFRIEGATSVGLIRVTFGRNALCENVVAVHANNSCIWYDRCYESRIAGCNVLNTGDGGDDYGIVISNSQDIAIDQCFCYGRRHAIAVTGLGAVGCVPNRNVRIYNSTLKNDKTANTHSADFHGNCEDCSFINCTIYGGATWQGKDTGYSSCRIFGSGGMATAVLGADIRGGTFFLDDSYIELFEDPQAYARGMIDVGGNSRTAVNAHTIEDCSFRIRGCRVVNRAATDSTILFKFRNHGSSRKMNFTIDDVDLDVASLGTVLDARLVSGTADSDFIQIDNVRWRGMAGTYNAYAGAEYARFLQPVASSGGDGGG